MLLALCLKLGGRVELDYSRPDTTAHIFSCLQVGVCFSASFKTKCFKANMHCRLTSQITATFYSSFSVSSLRCRFIVKEASRLPPPLPPPPPSPTLRVPPPLPPLLIPGILTRTSNTLPVKCTEGVSIHRKTWLC